MMGGLEMFVTVSVSSRVAYWYIEMFSITLVMSPVRLIGSGLTMESENIPLSPGTMTGVWKLPRSLFTKRGSSMDWAVTVLHRANNNSSTSKARYDLMGFSNRTPG